jgi:hypothetical protein
MALFRENRGQAPTSVPVSKDQCLIETTVGFDIPMFKHDGRPTGPVISLGATAGHILELGTLVSVRAYAEATLESSSVTVTSGGSVSRYNLSPDNPNLSGLEGIDPNLFRGLDAKATMGVSTVACQFCVNSRDCQAKKRIIDERDSLPGELEVDGLIGG